jgi:DNA-binding transcriptional MerR regulator
MENPIFHQPEIPDKLYFKVGEVSEITEIPTYVLRFWETEFKRMNPKRTPSGQRLYRKNDVELIFKIKHLLYEKKYTIEGAKQYLKTSSPQKSFPLYPKLFNEVRKELEAIRKLLN